MKIEQNIIFQDYKIRHKDSGILGKVDLYHRDVQLEKNEI
jgi:hypothetical protein